MLVNITFWPYSLMNVSYTVIGSMLAPTVDWNRVLVIAIIYLLALGISAHALDARGANKPWGRFLSDKQLLALALVAFIPAVSLGVYYALEYRLTVIWAVGLAEIFFLFAYNMEWFKGRFHTDGFFSLSWGAFPVAAGFTMQTDALSLPLLVMMALGFTTAYTEISASRPYRAIKKARMNDPNPSATSVIDGMTDYYGKQYERVLKAIIFSVALLALALVLMRL